MDNIQGSDPKIADSIDENNDIIYYQSIKNKELTNEQRQSILNAPSCSKILSKIEQLIKECELLPKNSGKIKKISLKLNGRIHEFNEAVGNINKMMSDDIINSKITEKHCDTIDIYPIPEINEEFIMLDGLKKISSELNGQKPDFDLAINKLQNLLLNEHVKSFDTKNISELVSTSYPEHDKMKTNDNVLIYTMATAVGVSITASLATVFFMKIIKKLI